MIDTPLPVRAIDGDMAGQAARGLPGASVAGVAHDVIRRLAGLSAKMVRSGQRTGPTRGPADIPALCDALVGLDPDAAGRMLRAAYADGANHEALCIDHIGAAADRLGQMWDADRVTYSDMTLAAGRMLGILRDLRTLEPAVLARQGRFALFATVPGEDHVLGVTMAADLFRDAGWDIDLRLGAEEAELVRRVRAQSYPIVGLSASSVARVPALARTIVALRVAAPTVLIFVGGQIARVEPDIAHHVGADAAAHDLDGCKAEMERLFKQVSGATPVPA